MDDFVVCQACFKANIYYVLESISKHIKIRTDINDKYFEPVFSQFKLKLFFQFTKNNVRYLGVVPFGRSIKRNY